MSKFSLAFGSSSPFNSKDAVLDLGRGQGASLKYWLEHYQVQQLEAIELQDHHVQSIRHHLNSNIKIHAASFLNLKALFAQPRFDVVFCIDAAYHSHLNSFLSQVSTVLIQMDVWAFII